MKRGSRGRRAAGVTGVTKQVGDYGMVELMSLLEEKRKLVDEKATNYRVNRDNTECENQRIYWCKKTNSTVKSEN